MPFVFNKQDPNPPVKFYLDEDKPEEGHVLIRSITAQEMEDIRKKCTKKKPPEYRRGVRYEVPPDVNERMQGELMWDSIIVGWDGIIDENGKKIPVSKENKIMFMRNWSAFATLVSNSLEQLTEDTKTIKEAEIKNSTSSQKG